MSDHIAVVGFGEAAQAFVGDAGWSGAVRVYDKLTDEPMTRKRKFADYARFGIEGADTPGESVDGADLILSLVTPRQARAAAMAATPLQPGAIYCDMNSVAPATKQDAAAAIDRVGGRHVDVAIMLPVNPARLTVPLLLSGPAAPDAERALRAAGFTNLRVIGNQVGAASAVKMIRSVIVKGLEALTAEAMLAAAEAGVTDEVLDSLDASERPMRWADRADYSLGRMMVHGARRAEEMEDAVRTLKSLGIEPVLTRGTVVRQCEVGALGLRPELGLKAKIAQLRPWRARAA